MLQLLEPIQVWAFFEKGIIKPHIFFWNKRQIKVEKINLVHTTRNGDHLDYHFSISSGGNFYRLGFSPNELKWFLEGVEESE